MLPFQNNCYILFYFTDACKVGSETLPDDLDYYLDQFSVGVTLQCMSVHLHVEC